MASQGPLWLTVLHAWEARLGISVGEHSPKKRQKLMDANDLFVGYIISILVDCLVDVYMHITDAKELWDAYATDAGCELYNIESFHDFRMVNNHSVVGQAHEVQVLVKELELVKCPYKFVARCIIAELSSS